jgi:hypothetical protein
MVNTGDPVRGRGTFIENERRTSFAGGYGLLEDVVLFPECKDVLVDLRKVKLLIFREFLAHSTIHYQG